MKIATILVVLLGAALVIGKITQPLDSAPTEEPATLEGSTAAQKSAAAWELPNTQGSAAGEGSQLNVEHDKQYLATREKIWKFLLDEGYEVETITGVPNIGKTDAQLKEGFEGWYAYLKHNGQWTHFSIVLYDGVIAAIQPIKK